MLIKKRVKRQLADAGLSVEGEAQISIVAVSAKDGLGITDLIETILLEADLLKLTADPARPAKGTVIEALLDKSRGPIATVIIQTGSIHIGDIVQVGSSYGKVRALYKNCNISLEESGPSSAVQLLGLNNLPLAGQILRVFSCDRDARQHAASHAEIETQTELASCRGALLTSGHMPSGQNKIHTINLIIKADATGTADAIKSALNRLPQDTVILRYIKTGVGQITESDIDLAVVSKGLVISFNLKTSGALVSVAKKKGVKIRTYKIIYDVIDDIKRVMEDKLAPLIVKTIKGKAEVKAVFGGGSRGKVAGCVVHDGRITVGDICMLRRNKKCIHEAKLQSLRRDKEQVKDIDAGKDCGIDVDGFKDWEVGDIIECYGITRKQQTLEEAGRGAHSLK